MPRISDTFGEKIGMSRRDIYRLGRELTLCELDDLVPEHPRIIPLLANKKRLWPKVEWPIDPGESGTAQRKNALQALIFMLLVRVALPPKHTPADKTGEASCQEAYIRKVILTRDASIQAAKNLPISFFQFVQRELPAIWPSHDARNRNAKIRKAIERRLGSLKKCTQNAFVAGYPEWQGNVIFQKDTYLKFANIQKQTGVVYIKPEGEQAFATREQFHQFIAKLTKPKKRKKSENQPPKRPILEKITRNGLYQDLSGIDATEFRKRFAFRGGEFGTWLSQKDRQLSLEWASSAFMDLAGILDIDEDKIGRNSLGFAFGARGVGGFQAAAAHYDTIFNVINLTKLYGAGSVAHEWAHFIDFMVLRPKGLGSNTMTWLYGHTPLQGIELVKERRKNLVKLEGRVITHLRIIDPAVAKKAVYWLASCSDWEAYCEGFTYWAKKAFDEDKAKQYLTYLKEQIEPFICGRENNFHANARLLDERRWRPYWLLPPELFARAFEYFVLDKLSSKGMHNDYLVNLYEHKISPYPDADEMGVFAPMLQKIVDSHITKLS